MNRTIRENPIPITLSAMSLVGLMLFASEVCSQTDYADIAGKIDISRVVEHIRYLSGLGSRIPGYPGADKAADYISKQFEDIGLEVISPQEFSVTVPYDAGATIEIIESGMILEMHSLWPNGVRTSTLPRGGIYGELIYGKKAELATFKGVDVTGRFVLLDFDCGVEWVKAVNLGAKAIIFIEPDEISRQEAERKFLSLPIDIPRFWVSKAIGEFLKRTLEKSFSLRVKLDARMEWRKVTAKNIIAKISPAQQEKSEDNNSRKAKLFQEYHGERESVEDERIIITAYYDSISVVPALAPGAENACGIAVLIEIARVLAKCPLHRTVIFVATSGHFTGMSGAAILTRSLDQLLTGTTQSKLDAAKQEVYALNARVEMVQDLIEKYGITPEMHWVLTKLDEGLDKNKKELTKIEDLFKIIKTESEPESVEAFEAREKSIEELLDEYGEHGELRNALKKTIAKLDVRKDAERKKPREEREREQKAKQELRTFLVSLDLSSYSRKVGLFARGSYEDNRDIYRQREYSPFARRMKSHAQTICEALNYNIDETFADTVNAIEGKSPEAFFQELFTFESEIASFALPAIAYATCNDTRTLIDTPHDLPSSLNFENIESQAKLLVCLLYEMANDKKLDINLHERRRIYEPIKGQVVEFDPQKGLVPDTPVPNSILMLYVDRGRKGEFVRSFPKPLYGVHLEHYFLTGGDGKFDFSTFLWTAGARLDAFRLNDDTGEIEYAMDLGTNGNERFGFRDLWVPSKGGVPITYVVFPCVATSLTDLVDPRYLLSLQYVNLIDAATESKPIFFGYSSPLITRYETSYVEPCLVLYTEPNSRIKLTMSLGLVGTRFILINGSKEDPEGIGIETTKSSVLQYANYQVAQDIYWLNDYRKGLLEKHGIVNNRLQELHRESGFALKRAEEALAKRDWVEFAKQSDEAWSLASRIYPDVLSTANDTVKGVIFYLALVVPFAYFIERLLFSFADIRKRIVATVGAFLTVLVILGAVHPAFEITLTPFLIFLAFVILALGVLVSGIVLGKFGNELKKMRGGLVGVRHTDVNRFSAAFAAFNLGVSYMRRRKVKTTLTCSTLIVLTFTILSFTSIQSYVKFNKYALGWSAPYNGVLYRNLDWGPLEEPEVERFQQELKGAFVLAPRAWHVTSRPEEFLNMEVELVGNEHEIAKYKVADIEAIVGMSHNEPLVTHIDKTLIMGKWFAKDDRKVCIIPATMAEHLGINRNNFSRAHVKIFGIDFNVKGVFSEDKFSEKHDLNDDESQLSPVSFRVRHPIVRQRNEEVDPAQIADEEFDYMRPSSIIIVPFETLISRGGTVRSIAAVPTGNFSDDVMRAAETKKIDPIEAFLEKLMRGWSVIVYAGIEGNAYLYSSIGRSALQGLSNLLIPIAIAALIILNTMLGSVYEREREIWTYSSVGLSPIHISSLFIAESCVYAVVGSVTGYLIGQVIAKIVTTQEIVLFGAHFANIFFLPGLTLNYSSGAAVFSTFLVMVVTIASTIYPAKRAHELAVPDIEKAWQLTQPSGETWILHMPFIIQDVYAPAFNAYMKEFFEMHREESVGNFCAHNVTFSKEPDHSRGGESGGGGYQLSFDCWLAPYDFGVSQRVAIKTLDSGDPNLMTFQLILNRMSGDVASWQRTNKIFLNTLRKMFLIWRVMRAEDRRYYEEKGQEMAKQENLHVSV